MRVNRSKKYRKIMSNYCLHFNFRTPYQVLCDSNFLRTCYNFKMPIIQFLANTVHGEAKPYITQCSLATAMEQHKKKVQKGKESQKGRGDGKPEWLPPPTTVPLRYCKHKNEAGEDIGPFSEEDCLLDLLSGQVKGNELPKNKNHYILASADTEQAQQGHKSNRALIFRQQARSIPGVPVVYVSKSVMVLEELSGASMAVINKAEKAKLKEGLISKDRGTKRKREEDDGELEDANEAAENGFGREGGPKIRGLKKPKAPNPLSVKKKKTKDLNRASLQSIDRDEDGNTRKKKNRRLRGKKHKGEENDPSKLLDAATVTAES